MTISDNRVGAESPLLVRNALADLIELHDVTIGRDGRVQLRGRLLYSPDKAYTLAAERLRPLGYTPLFRRVGSQDVIQALPFTLAASPSRNWLAFLFLGLTALSMLFVGALNGGWDPAQGLPAGLLIGLPFAGSLLAILGAHEMGHYLVSRHYGVPVSLPYFIPMPFSHFGTMGAVVRMKAPPINRRQLLAIGAAGPLAGLAVAVPLLIVGLKLSVVGPQVFGPGVIIFGDSLLLKGVQWLIYGRFYPGGGEDIWLHPVGFAAWAGLFVTALNLIPAGQLDGGHIIYSLIGPRARYLTFAIVAVLALLGFFLWDGWLLWAALVMVFGWASATPFDDITRLDRRGIALAIAMLVIWMLVFTPVPLIQM